MDKLIHYRTKELDFNWALRWSLFVFHFQLKMQLASLLQFAIIFVTVEPVLIRCNVSKLGASMGHTRFHATSKQAHQITAKDYLQLLLLSQFSKDPQASTWMRASWPVALNSTKLSYMQLEYLYGRVSGDLGPLSFDQFSTEYSKKSPQFKHMSYSAIASCTKFLHVNREEFFSCLSNKVASVPFGLRS